MNTTNKILCKYFILSLLFIFSLSSCSSVISGLYGINKISIVYEETIQRYSNKYDIPLSDSYQLDSNYMLYLKSLDTIKYAIQIKNHYQPLQALYYDKSGQLKSFQVNCYTGGFPNFNWNRNETMLSFPPKQQAPLDSLILLYKHLSYIKALSKSEKISIDNFDYFVIVHWNRFMGRQSKRLIKYIQQNCKLATGKKVKIIYVNTDNLFSKEMKK
jgi:hypothetical protein